MKSILKKIYLWTIIVVVFQTLVLLFLNNIYFNPNGKIKITKWKPSTAKSDDTKKKTFSVPAGAQDLKVSYDAKFLAYKLNGVLEIYDVEKKKSTSLAVDGSPGVSYYEWLFDRNIVVFSYMASDDKSGIVEVTTYNAIDGTTHNFGKEEPGTYVISDFSEGTRAVDFELSPLTNVMYVILQYNENRYAVARYDIQDNLTYVMWDTPIKTFRCTYLNDNLLYFKYPGTLTIRNGVNDSTRTYDFNENYILLGSTYDDHIYLGEADGEGKIGKVKMFAADSQDPESAQELTLPAKVSPEDINFNYSGHLFVVDKATKTVHDMLDSNKKQFTYKDDFVSISESHIVTRQGNNVTIEAF